jgi:hypothetical protein
MGEGHEHEEAGAEFDPRRVHTHEDAEGNEFSHAHLTDAIGLGVEVTVNLTISEEMAPEALMAERARLTGAQQAMYLAQQEWQERNGEMGLAEAVTFSADIQALGAVLGVLDRIIMRRGFTPVEMRAVKSSNIAKIGWRGIEADGVTGDVIVEFHNGGLYAYQGVPRELFQALIEADSPGGFLNAAIKPMYRVLRIDIPNQHLEVVPGPGTEG